MLRTGNASLRPRDTALPRKHRCGIAPHRLSSVSFRKLFRFPANPTRFVIARRARAPDAAILNGTIRRPGTNYGCAERNRTLKERERKRNEARESMFFVIGISSCFVLPCFAVGCLAFGFKIATAALRPRNDTELGRFYLENGRFSFFAVIFCAVSLRIVFQTFRTGNCFVFPQNLSVLSLRGGRVRPTRQSLTKRFLYCFCRIWELVSLFSPASRLFFQKNDVS